MIQQQKLISLSGNDVGLLANVDKTICLNVGQHITMNEVKF